MDRAWLPSTIAQEVYALLTCYQTLRIAITDAIEATGGIDPDRGSFTTALSAARDLLTQAANVIDLIGAIGCRVLDNLLPDRRLRVSPRIVKRAISKYQARGQHQPAQYKATSTSTSSLHPDPDTPHRTADYVGANRHAAQAPAIARHPQGI